MKKICWLIACLFALTGTAQDKLVLMGVSPDLYVIHTVNGQESMQDISNQFGQSVTKLSTYNKLTTTGPLPKGTQVKIPLTQYNLIRTKGDENSAPVYHIMQKGDNLYKLSKLNNISMASLREWNNLTTDIVKDDQAIIIGYMVNARITPLKKISEEKINEKTTEPAPVIKPDAETRKTTVKQPVVPLLKKEEVPLSLAYVPKEGDEGYFALPYAQHAKELSQQFHSGDAATFKTISGWTDRKYYVLINDVAPETLVRITAPNNKSICAKVLGPLQETRGGSGLLLRMSNSAASTLGITEAKFTVTLTYFE